jgi:hypothetical protein
MTRLLRVGLDLADTPANGSITQFPGRFGR